MNRRELAELAGLLASCIGTVGSILLAFPLFHLLRAREAIEDLERNLEVADPAEERSAAMRAALRALKLHVRERRRIATRVGIGGVILLAITGALLLAQIALVYL